jgi:hypothetical protein
MLSNEAVTSPYTSARTQKDADVSRFKVTAHNLPVGIVSKQGN